MRMQATQWQTAGGQIATEFDSLFAEAFPDFISTDGHSPYQSVTREDDPCPSTAPTLNRFISKPTEPDIL